MQVLVEKILKGPNFIMPVAAFAKQRVIDAVETELMQAPEAMKETPSPPNRSSSIFSGATSGEDSRVRRSRHKCRKRKNRKCRDRSEDAHEYRRCSNQSRSSTDGDSSLKSSKSKPSSWSPCYRLGCVDCDRQKRHTRFSKEKLEVIHLVCHRFKKAVDFRTYRFANKPTGYKRSVSKCIAKMKLEKQMTARTRPQIVISFDPTSIIEFLKNFKLTCSTNGLDKDAVMWLFHFFMNKTTSIVLNAGLIAARTDEEYCRSVTGNMRYFTAYLQEVNFLLKKQATDEVVKKQKLR